MKRFIPLLAVLFILAVLAALYAPGMLDRLALSRSAGRLLESIRAGDRSAILSQVSPAQQQDFGELLERFAPAGYEQYIEKLSSQGSEDAGPGSRWLKVSCRLQSSAGPAVYQARLLWRKENGVWLWDPAGSLAAPFSPSGEPNWLSLGDLMQQQGADI